jgi:hypothetical protein
MPTDQQLKDYVQSLPEIYVHILRAFPDLEPNRRQGYGLFLQTIADDFDMNTSIRFGIDEVILACQELERHGLVEIKNNIFVHPTPLGERLIAQIAGPQAPPVRVDPLPALPA